jgi:phosphoserine phosphatase
MLGLSHVVCSRLEVAQGRFTGRPIEPICYGAGKIVWAERFASERNVTLKDCAFYSDSYTDLPMLERVGRPVVVNPDPRLRRAAKQRGWPIENWR